MGAVNYYAAFHLAFTRSAGTVFAAIGQANSLTNPGRQNGLVCLDEKRTPAGQYVDREFGCLAGVIAHLLVILGLNYLHGMQFCLQTKPHLAHYPLDFDVNAF
jgi:hypothetical protein